MDKSSLSSFLWIAVTIIIMLTILAFASPYGVYIRETLITFTGDFVEKSDNTGVKTDNQTFILTITYDIPEDSGISIVPLKKTLKKYESYSILSPTIPGYKPNISVVSGKIDSDTNVVVKYTAT